MYGVVNIIIIFSSVLSLYIIKSKNKLSDNFTSLTFLKLLFVIFKDLYLSRYKVVCFDVNVGKIGYGLLISDE